MLLDEVLGEEQGQEEEGGKQAAEFYVPSVHLLL